MTLQELPPVKELVLSPPQRILVVEDDPAISYLIVKLLEHNWFYTVSRCNGTQAALAFDPRSIDLLITDLRMDGGGGIELIKRVRAISQVPIIIVTAFAADYANEVRFLDDVVVMNKPFDARKLLHAVEQALPIEQGPVSEEEELEVEAEEFEAPPSKPIRFSPISPELIANIAKPAPVRVLDKKILIVDDDSEFLMMMSLMLQDAGYRVVSAGNVVRAIQLAVEETPDLLLVDIHMGEEDGYAIQERLDQFKRMAGIPVIYVTGDQSNWTKFTTTAMGAQALLQKPFEKEQLLAVIRRALA